MRYSSKKDIDTITSLVVEGEPFDYYLDSLISDAYGDGEHNGYETGLYDSGERAGGWIQDGQYDYEVVSRAGKLGYVKYSEVDNTGNDLLQQLHRQEHPDRAYHFSFCGKCSTIDT